MSDINDNNDPVAYLGPEASYTHQAALSLFPTRPNTLQPLPSIPSLFTALTSTHTTAVVPLENSSNGSVLPTLDALAVLSPQVTIVGDTYLPVQHALLARPLADGSTPAVGDVKRVYSHPQAWGQCTLFLEGKLGHATRVDTDSTSAAARKVAEADPGSGVAALASGLAGAMYGLVPVERKCADRGDNETRFLVLRRRRRTGHAGTTTTTTTTTTAIPAEGGATKKTLLHFRVSPHVPGALADALAVFKRYGLSLTSFYTRPDPEPPTRTETQTEAERGRGGWRYIFFVEFEAPGGVDIGPAVEELRGKTTGLRVCGSWKRSS
ncbi:PDT-domain-containing protein [Myriangium duriaei CBS 260.36]|uniref:prephenate dehydratase n=1 Tax=Myriangium duriaei CBS 260.36 TaxID=1168546 RepID=A0A9P4JA27_9PEZI|nr:PDT-domain-containing protein [Myriangium duriaei CBS 260.36]